MSPTENNSSISTSTVEGAPTPATSPQTDTAIQKPKRPVRRRVTTRPKADASAPANQTVTEAETASAASTEEKPKRKRRTTVSGTTSKVTGGARATDPAPSTIDVSPVEQVSAAVPVAEHTRSTPTRTTTSRRRATKTVDSSAPDDSETPARVTQADDAAGAADTVKTEGSAPTTGVGTKVRRVRRTHGADTERENPSGDGTTGAVAVASREASIPVGPTNASPTDVSAPTTTPTPSNPHRNQHGDRPAGRVRRRVRVHGEAGQDEATSPTTAAPTGGSSASEADPAPTPVRGPAGSSSSETSSAANPASRDEGHQEGGAPSSGRPAYQHRPYRERDRTEQRPAQGGQPVQRQQRPSKYPSKGYQGNSGKYSSNSNGNNSNGKGGYHNEHRNRNRHEVIEPQVSRDELAELKVGELREKAVELGIEAQGVKKAELVDLVFNATLAAEGFVKVSGILDLVSEGYGYLRVKGYLPSPQDAYVVPAVVHRYNLRKGDYLTGQLRPVVPGDKFPSLHRVDTINGVPSDILNSSPRVKFAELTPIYPDERLTMEHGKDSTTARTIDLVAPIGKGQRGLIVSPPKAGKTTVLKDIAAAISANNPDVHLMCLLVDERPEEVTDMQRSVKGEVIASTFDMPSENHIAVSELVIERAKRLVEMGQDVVILLDSITRLARAYNLAQPASGRILSGGVDSTALYPPKRFLGAARNIEYGGSLTIMASALIDTGSKMDEVIFEEFKGTGNMELKLDRNLADRRIFPAIDVVASGTRKEELLNDPQMSPFIWGVRRILANLNNTERATEMLIKSLKRTDTNEEFLIRSARRANEQSGSTLGV